MLLGNLPPLTKNRTCAFTGHRILKEDFSFSDLKEDILKPVYHYLNLLFFTICLILLSFNLGGTQNFSTFSLIPLLLYSSKEGKYKLKYLFYVFYPAHIIILWIIKVLII